MFSTDRVFSNLKAKKEEEEKVLVNIESILQIFKTQIHDILINGDILSEIIESTGYDIEVEEETQLTYSLPKAVTIRLQSENYNLPLIEKFKISYNDNPLKDIYLTDESTSSNLDYTLQFSLEPFLYGITNENKLHLNLIKQIYTNLVTEFGVKYENKHILDLSTYIGLNELNDNLDFYKNFVRETLIKLGFKVSYPQSFSASAYQLLIEVTPSL